jgi:site-specific recombinase XerD
MASLKALKTQFLEYVEIEKGRSLKTVENYDHYLSRFLEFAKTDSPSNITDSLVREFRLWLNRQPSKYNKEGGGTVRKRTQNYYMIALRAFLKYLARQDIKSLAPDRIELAKIPERELDLITPVELKRLMDSPSGSDIKDLRDKAILEMLFFYWTPRLRTLLPHFRHRPIERRLFYTWKRRKNTSYLYFRRSQKCS